MTISYQNMCDGCVLTDSSAASGSNHTRANADRDIHRVQHAAHGVCLQGLAQRYATGSNRVPVLCCAKNGYRTPRSFAPTRSLLDEMGDRLAAIMLYTTSADAVLPSPAPRLDLFLRQCRSHRHPCEQKPCLRKARARWDPRPSLARESIPVSGHTKVSLGHANLVLRLDI